MTVLQELRDEHALIARALAVVERTVAGLQVGAPADREVLVLLLEFCQAFADSFHQRKEEFLLLPWLRNCGVEFETSPMVRLRRDHARTRELMRTLSEESASRDTVGPRLVETLREFVVHLRRQIAFEEGVVFKAAEEFEGASRELDEAWSDVGGDSERVAERAREIVRILEERLPVPLRSS